MNKTYLKATEIVKNMTPSLIDSFYKEHQDTIIKDYPKNTHKLAKFIRDTLAIPAGCGKNQEKYWILRGWDCKPAFAKTKSKRLSPFSKEFWMAKGLSESDAIYKANSIRPIKKEYWIEKGHSEKESIKLAEKAKSDNNNKGARASAKSNKHKLSSPRRVDYWMREYQLSEAEAKARVSEYQATFSLSKCINKYGEDEGYYVWKSRQDNWQATMKNKSEEEISRINKLKLTGGFSISQAEKTIIQSLSDPLLETQHTIKGSKTYIVDFKLNNKIVEYFGDYWHMNPLLHESDSYNKTIKSYAHEIWSKDQERISDLKNLGYEILIIWEYDYKANPENSLKTIKEFLYGN